MTKPRWPPILLPALSLSIGWGIRGNFGHEFGALIPGALAAMAAVLLSGRDDWLRRIAYFGAFGAVGWCFGGSISYMQVIAYTHSGDSPSVLYGFACLFVIGFLWAAMGGAGTALPAFLSRERLAEFFPPLIAIYTVWIVHEFTYDALNAWLAPRLAGTFIAQLPLYRPNEPLFWYDADWTSALLAVVTTLVYAGVRRRIDSATALILHMAMGWCAAFLLFPVLLGWRMTPPRGDSWAGCVGMVAGMWLFLQRNGLGGVTFASLTTGFIGGLAFAGATLLKLMEIIGRLETNWHSVLEQTYGLFNGVGVAVTVLWLASRAPRMSDDPPVRRWTDWFAAGFVLLFISYVNLFKNPEEWVKKKVFPPTIYWFQTITWFNIGYLALAATVLFLLIRHMRKPLPVMPPTWLGKGQLLYVLFLWWMIVGNLDRAQAGFAEQRLVTEGVILLNACVCTILVLLYGREGQAAPEQPVTNYRALNRQAVRYGLAAAALATLLNGGLVRAVWGDKFAGQARLHIRFGPRATTQEKPR